MWKKRRWSEWPRKIREELNSVASVVGVGGIVIAVAGEFFQTGNARLVLVIVGGVIAIGAVVYAIRKAMPPTMRNASNLVGDTLDLTELDNIFPPIRKLAIVGLTSTGKTTLKNRLQFQPPPNERTQAARATIVSIPTKPVTYLAVLDGGGENYSQQFKIAESADHLCLVIDHNRSDNDPKVSNERKEETKEFMTRIREHLRETESPQKIWIEVLVNKKDLWEAPPNKDRETFIDFVNEETEKWKDGNFSKDVRMKPHSNQNADDVARFMDRLKSTLSS